MKFRFWGVRGSIPVPGKQTVRYGGNTPCCEIIASSGHRIVIDAGSGMIPLGTQICQEPEARSNTLLLTHTHWDHIQGFPFFAPFHKQNTPWDVYGPRRSNIGLAELLERSLGRLTSPIASTQEFRAKLTFHELEEGEFQIGSLRIKHLFVPHTTLTLCYRFEENDKALVFATDLEYLGEEAEAQKQRMAAYFQGADILIHDGMFTDEEYPRYRGWGHATMEECIELAKRAAVPTLYIYHHDPKRGDDSLDAVLAALQSKQPTGGPTILMAKEGDTLML